MALQLVQFAPHRTVMHEVALLEDSPATCKDESKPDIIIGRDLIKALGLTLDFAEETPMISWEYATVPIVPRGYWTKDCLQEIFPISAISAAEKNFEDKSPSMLAASYWKDQVDLRTLVPSHLKEHQQDDLYQLHSKYQSVFDGDLGTLPGKPMELELKSPNLRPYLGLTYPIPKIHEKLVREEVDRLCGLKVLQRVNESEWGAPSFGIPKKNGEIRFVSDFRQLNKVLHRKPYPLRIQRVYFRSLDGFSYCTSMDLKMGFWDIHLSPYSQKLCTIVLPWGKYRYLRLPIGLSVSPDIYQEKMSNLFMDMPEVIVYIDDILVIKNLRGSSSPSCTPSAESPCR
jgi:Reverse transcriptase (RNA-dependent DNA polymerase)